MAERRQTASLMIVTRTDASHPNEPYYVMDKRSRSYIEIMLGMSVHDFYTTFEAWCISGLAGVGNSDNDRRNMLKKTARQIMCRKLRKSSFFLLCLAALT